MRHTSPVGGTAGRAVPAAFVAGTLVYLAFLVARPGSPTSITAVNDVGQALVPLAVTVPLGLRAARRATGRLRRSWLLLAGAALSWGLGQVVWTWYEAVLGQEVPYPGLADVGFLLCVPLLLAGVLTFPSSSLRTMGRARAVVDGLITVSAVLFASYGTFLGEVYASSEGGGFERVLAVTYPVADVVIVAVVLAVVARRTDRFSGPLPVLAAGAVCLAVADSAFAYMAVRGTYGDDPVTDLFWPLGFALIGYAAWLPQAVASAQEPRRGPSSGWGVAVPYLPVVLAVAVFAARSVGGAEIGAFLGVTGSVLVVLLVVRQVVTLLENRELTADLELTVEELRHREGQLEFQAFHDPLTELANRALFRDRLEHAVEQRRTSPVSVLFVDLDDFKTVNDSLGHDAGDRLLVAVAERLRACVRVGDTVARLGGDEFAILLEGPTAADDGPPLAQRVLAALDVPFSIAGRDLRLSASLGLAGGHLASAEGLLQDADLAMYAAKANGKARVEVYQHRMRTSAIDRLDLVADVQRAVEGEELVVHFQPVVDLTTLEVEGHEALVRWQHPRRGLLGPDAFIAMAEETGALVSMGWWVLEEACAQAAGWPAGASGAPGSVGVNLSARQVLDPAAVTVVAGVLDRTGIDPARVVLEITESVLLDVEEIAHRLHQLRTLGVRLAIDDFGTGYSSLSYLTRLPVDMVKVDRAFVERLGGPPGDEVLVRAVVQLARSLGMRSVGEGVETSAQLERLRDFGCDAAQGFLLGKPAADPSFDLGSLRPMSRSLGEPGGASGVQGS